MSISCTDCSRCGRCYNKDSTCARCGSPIFLLDDNCVSCGEPITDEMREAARAIYMRQKKEERRMLFEMIKANREKNKT